MLRGILFLRGDLHVGGLYRSAAGRVWIRGSVKNTRRSKYLKYCVYFKSFEGGAILLSTPRRHIIIPDGGLCVKKTPLAHIFSHLVPYQSSFRQTRKKCNVSIGRENLKLDLGVAGSLHIYATRVLLAYLAHILAPSATLFPTRVFVLRKRAPGCSN
jgi:hypothetical protein